MQPSGESGAGCIDCAGTAGSRAQRPANGPQRPLAAAPSARAAAAPRGRAQQACPRRCAKTADPAPSSASHRVHCVFVEGSEIRARLRKKAHTRSSRAKKGEKLCVLLRRDAAGDCGGEQRVLSGIGASKRKGVDKAELCKSVADAWRESCEALLQKTCVGGKVALDGVKLAVPCKLANVCFVGTEAPLALKPVDRK